jgi:Ca2+-binding RTX toxin-like protein
MSATVSISGGGSASVTVYGNGTVYAGNGDDTVKVTGIGKVVVGNGNDSINVWGANASITAGSGHDTITLHEGGTITQLGTGGHDTINLGYGSDTVYEQGQATVYGSNSGGKFGGATIHGGTLQVSYSGSTETEIAVSGKMTLLGSGACTEFVGGTGTSVFIGGHASDTFVGGSGSDTLIGGTGYNKFEFLSSEAGGQHVITNFVSSDRLYIEGYTLSYLESHHDVTTANGNTYISIDDGKTTIELKGFTGLNSSDITTHK